MEIAVATNHAKVLGAGDGLRLYSGPGRDLIFKVTGEDTGGAFDYFIVEVAPKGGPPLHVHHKQEETIHVLKGRYKVRIGLIFITWMRVALRICRQKFRMLS